MPLTLEAKNRALRAILAGPVQVGLLVGDQEETDANYRRQPIIMLPADGEPSAQWMSAEEVRFPGWATASSVTGWALYDGGGIELSRESFESPTVLKARERLTFGPGDLMVELEG